MPAISYSNPDHLCPGRIIFVVIIDPARPFMPYIFGPAEPFMHPDPRGPQQGRKTIYFFTSPFSPGFKRGGALKTRAEGRDYIDIKLNTCYVMPM